MTDSSSAQSSFPSFAVAIAIALLLVLLFVFWPSSEPDEPAQSPVNVPLPAPVVDDIAPPLPTAPEAEETTNETFVEVAPLPEVNVEDLAEVTEEFVAPVEVEDEEPEPLDITDRAVKQTLLAVSKVPMLATLVVNEGLLERTVATIANVANGDTPANLNLLKAPKGEFEVFKQAKGTFVTPASFNRYTPYAEAFAEIETSDLIALLDMYYEELETRFAQIASPDTDFDDALLGAINELLDTPMVSTPIAVQTDRAMYQYANPQLEALSPAQKQLLRMGPANMRMVMKKLRELRDALQNRD